MFGYVDFTPSWCTTGGSPRQRRLAISKFNGWDSPGLPASEADARRAVPQPAHLPHRRPSNVVTRVDKGGTEPIRTTHRPNRHAGTEPRTPRQPGRSAAERPVGPGASLGLAAASVGMIDDVTATTPTAPAPAPTPQAPAVAARAVRRAQARDLTSAAAARWLTTEATTQLGRAITLSITRYARDHRQQPTWADALSGVDPTLRAPMTTAPADWPLPAAVWRRELRLRLMGQLKRTRWITYTATPDHCTSAPRDAPGSPRPKQPRLTTGSATTPSRHPHHRPQG